MKCQIWYATGTGFGNPEPDPSNLSATHVHLKDLDVEADSTNLALEHIFNQMQGEVWSSGAKEQAEAQAMIKSKGLSHTSMSVGDVAVDPHGGVWLVASFGFKNLGRVNEHAKS